MRPSLKAVVLDFSTVGNVDLTAIQVLIDARTQLDRFSQPNSVQWHFANVSSRWTKRALVAAGFGVPTPTSSDGMHVIKERVIAVGEVDTVEIPPYLVFNYKAAGTGAWNGFDQDVELAALENQDEINQAGPDIASAKTVVTTTEFAGSGTSTTVPVLGINYPFFHVNLEDAIESARTFIVGEQEVCDASGLVE